VLALCGREGHGAYEPARLGGIVVRDRGLQVLAQRRRLAQLPPQPAEEAHGRLVCHRRQANGPRDPSPDGDNDGVKEILPEIEAWKNGGEKVVVATVVATRRSSPRPIGASLAISESGKMCGSVSGGCVESDVFENAQEVFETGEPKLLNYGISDDLAWSVGLPCGGEIDVFVERLE
jgi:hypothetical protein